MITKANRTLMAKWGSWIICQPCDFLMIVISTIPDNALLRKLRVWYPTKFWIFPPNDKNSVLPRYRSPATIESLETGCHQNYKQKSTQSTTGRIPVMYSSLIELWNTLQQHNPDFCSGLGLWSPQCGLSYTVCASCVQSALFSGKSARVHRLPIERARVSPQQQIKFFSFLTWKFQHEAEAANDVFPFNCQEVSKTNR